MADLQAGFPVVGVNSGSDTQLIISVNPSAGVDRAMAVTVQGEGDIAGEGTRQVSSITANGDNLTLKERKTSGNQWAWTEVWELANPDAGVGAYNVIINLNAADIFTAQVWVADDVDQTTPLLDAVIDGGTAGTAATANLTDCDAGDILFDSLCIDATSHGAGADPSQTEEHNFENVGHTGCASWRVAIGSNENMDWGWLGSAPFAYIATGFKTISIPPQELRPEADITTTGWATAPLWSKIEEAIADGTIISGVAGGGTPTLPVYRATSAKAVTTTAAVAVLAPAGVATGDLEILIGSTIAGGTLVISANGGSAWTAMSGTPIDVTGGEKLYVWWRVRQAGDSNPSIDPTTDHAIGVRIAYQAGTFDAVDPFENENTGSETTSDTSFSFAAAGSTSGAERLVCCIASSGFDSNTHQVPVMTNAQLTALASRITDGNTTQGGGGGFGMTEGRRATAGALGTFACTYATASPKSYIAFAIKPKMADTSTSIAEVLLADGVEPATRTDHVIRCRARVTSGTGIFRARLYEGGTAITADISSGALTGSLVDFDLLVPDADAADITAYTDLRIRFYGFDSQGSFGTFEVDQLWLEAPDAGGPVPFEKTGSLTTGARTVGVDVSERTETGALVTDTALVGADVSERSETGALVATGLLAGVALEESLKAGSLIATSLLAGFDFVEHPQFGSLIATGRLVGADVAEHVETGSLVSDTLLVGADVSERSETGSLVADSLLAGADVSEHNQTGSLVADTLLAGTSVKEGAGKAGSLITTGRMVGIDAAELNRLGSLIADSLLAGVDSEERSKLGSLATDTLLAGVDVSERSETGSLVADTLLAGLRNIEAIVTGSLAADTLLAGVGLKAVEGREGSLVAGTRLAGIDTAEHSRTGVLIADTLLAGARLRERARAGSIVTSARLAGLSVSEYVRAGALLTQAALRGADEATLNRLGSLVVGTSISGVSLLQLFISDFSKGKALIFRRDSAETSTIARRDRGWALIKSRREE